MYSCTNIYTMNISVWEFLLRKTYSYTKPHAAIYISPITAVSTRTLYTACLSLAILYYGDIII